MKDLIARLAAKAGVEDAVAEKTIGIVPGFLRSQETSGKVHQVPSDRLPGAEAAGAIGQIIAGMPGLGQFA